MAHRKTTKKNVNSLVDAWYRLENALRDTDEVEVQPQANQFFQDQLGGQVSSSSRKPVSSNYTSARPQSSLIHNGANNDVIDSEFLGLNPTTKKNPSHLKLNNSQKFTPLQARPSTAIQFGARKLQGVQSQGNLQNVPERAGLKSAGGVVNSRIGSAVSNVQMQHPGSAVSQVSSLKSLMNLRAQSRPFSRNGVDNPHVAKKSDLELLSQIPPEQINELIQKSETVKSLPVDSILDLFHAKCRDQKVEYMPDQAVKFIEKLKRICIRKSLCLRECGLSVESAHVLGEILVANQHFCRVDFQRNCIGDTGAAIIGESLRYNFNVIHLDLSSNAISPEGFQILFESLLSNSSLISLDIQSREGLNRNKLATQGSEALCNFLSQTETIQILNISGTTPGEEGSLKILEGISRNKSLVSINIGYNELSTPFIEFAVPKLCNSNLIELNLQGNCLSDSGTESLSQMTGLNSRFYKFELINLANNSISSLGAGALFDSIQKNQTLKSLVLDGNLFSGNRFNSIQNMLWENNVLEVLSIKNCEIEVPGGEAIGLGLQRNMALKELYLSDNNLLDAGSKEIAQGIKVSETLIKVDLSICQISDDSGMLIAEAIKSNETIREINLKENSLHDYTGIILAEAARENQNLQKCEVIRNPISFKYQEEIQQCLAVNIDIHKRGRVPHYIQTMEELKIFEKGKYDDYQRQEILNKHQRDAQRQYDEKKYTLEKETKIEEMRTLEVTRQLDQIKEERRIIEQYMAEEERAQNVDVQETEDLIQTTSNLIGITNGEATRMAQQKKEKRDYLTKVTVQSGEQVKNATVKLNQIVNSSRAQDSLIESNQSLNTQQKQKIEQMLARIFELESRPDGAAQTTNELRTDRESQGNIQQDASKQPAAKKKAPQKSPQQKQQPQQQQQQSKQAQVKKAASPPQKK